MTDFESDVLEFDDEPGAPDAQAQGKDNENKKILSAINSMYSLLKTIAKEVGVKGGEGKYPYPKANEISKENDELKKKVAEYEKKEKETKVNELLSIEVEKGLVSEQNKADIFKSYMDFSVEQITGLKKKAENVGSIPSKKGFKQPEMGAGTDKKEFTEKKKELEQRIKDFRECSLSTSEPESELKKLIEENSLCQ